MKRKSYVFLLVIISAAALAFAFLGAGGVVSQAAAFPFEQIAWLLRNMSLSGSVGNAAAIILYCAISIAPCAYLPYAYIRKRLYVEDVCLPVISILIFISIYLMINPSYITAALGSAAGGMVGRALLGGSIYALFIAYAVSRLMRVFKTSKAIDLYKSLYVFAAFIGIVFAVCAFGVCVSDFLSSISSVKASNTMPGLKLMPTYIFIGLSMVVDIVPLVFDIIIVVMAMDILEKLKKDRFDESIPDDAKRISGLCAGFLSISLFLNAGIYILQLIFAKQLYVIDAAIGLPLVSIAFVLCVMLLSFYIRENKQLKDENDGFI